MRYGFLGRVAAGTTLVVATSSGLFAGPVSAATRAAPAVTCKKLSATYPANSGKLTLCTASATGGSGALSKFTPGGGTIAWHNGTKTVYTSTPTGETDPTEARKCPSADREVEITGKVTTSTNPAIAAGAAVKAEVCVTPPTPTGGKLFNEPGTAFTIG